MSVIGILGGMGPQASAKLLSMLVEKSIKTTGNCPEIVLMNVPVPNFVSNKQNMSIAKTMLIKRTKILEKAGCTVIGIACNTAHLMLADLQSITSVPFVSLPNLVAEKINELGFKKVGLLASPNTLLSRLFDEALGWRYRFNSTR